jgi:hypothetical protein
MTNIHLPQVVLHCVGGFFLYDFFLQPLSGVPNVPPANRDVSLPRFISQAVGNSIEATQSRPIPLGKWRRKPSARGRISDISLTSRKKRGSGNNRETDT